MTVTGMLIECFSCDRAYTKSTSETGDINVFSRHEMNLCIIYVGVSIRLCSHRNAMVRNATARHLSSVVELIGPNRVLREFPDKVLPVAARFLLDGSQEARYDRVACHE